MLQALTDDDIIKFRASERAVFKLQTIIFFPLAILVSLLSGIFGLKGWGYWLTVVTMLTLMTAGYLLYLLSQIIAHRKDIHQKQKRVVTVRVISKTTKDGKRILLTNNTEIKQIDLFNKNAFDIIQEGDILNVEQTLNGKYLLRLERDGQNLLNVG